MPLLSALILISLSWGLQGADDFHVDKCWRAAQCSPARNQLERQKTREDPCAYKVDPKADGHYPISFQCDGALKNHIKGTKPTREILATLAKPKCFEMVGNLNKTDARGHHLICYCIEPFCNKGDIEKAVVSHWNVTTTNVKTPMSTDVHNDFSPSEPKSKTNRPETPSNQSANKGRTPVSKKVPVRRSTPSVQKVLNMRKRAVKLVKRESPLENAAPTPSTTTAATTTSNSTCSICKKELTIPLAILGGSVAILVVVCCCLSNEVRKYFKEAKGPQAKQLPVGRGSKEFHPQPAGSGSSRRSDGVVPYGHMKSVGNSNRPEVNKVSGESEMVGISGLPQDAKVSNRSKIAEIPGGSTGANSSGKLAGGKTSSPKQPEGAKVNEKLDGGKDAANPNGHKTSGQPEGTKTPGKSGQTKDSGKYHNLTDPNCDSD